MLYILILSKMFLFHPNIRIFVFFMSAGADLNPHRILRVHLITDIIQISSILVKTHISPCLHELPPVKPLGSGLPVENHDR